MSLCSLVDLRPHSGSWPPLKGLHDHTHWTHTQFDSSERVISPTQVTLTGNTQHSKERDIHAPCWIEPTKSASELSQTHALDQRDHWNRKIVYIIQTFIHISRTIFIYFNFSYPILRLVSVVFVCPYYIYIYIQGVPGGKDLIRKSVS